MNQKKQRILLTGFTGQVGNELAKIVPNQFELVLARNANGNRLDLRKLDELATLVREVKPAIILNPAAYTAVDKAETEREDAKILNTAVPELLAKEAHALGAILVHYSTDYVFDGSPQHGPWYEEDETGPLNVYGATKLAGEKAVQQFCRKHLIFRTSWVYSSHGHNFLKTMLRLSQEREQLKVVNDQIGAPTSAKFLARMTFAALETALTDENKFGLYHLSCSQKTSWHGFASEIIERAKNQGLKVKTTEILLIPSSEFPTPAQRPQNSEMNCGKFEKNFSVRLQSWPDALNETLGEYLPNLV